MALPAGQFVGMPVGEFFHAHERQCFAHAPVGFVFGRFDDAQAVGDVFARGQMREDGVGLKHHIHRAHVRRQAAHVFAVYEYLARVRLFKAAEHAQQCRLAAAGRSEQGEEFLVLHLQRNIVNRLRAAEVFADIFDVYDCGHFSLRCARIARMMSAAVNTIRQVEAALTSGVTEKRTIELIFTGRVMLPGPAVK